MKQYYFILKLFLIPTTTAIGATKYIPTLSIIKDIPYPNTDSSEFISTLFRIEETKLTM